MILNQLIVSGRLGRDAEMSFTPTGKPKTKFSIAVWMGRDKPAWWVNVTCWGDLAEKHATLNKGTEVVVVGRVDFSQYTNKDGQKRDWLECVAASVQLVGKPADVPVFVEEEEAFDPARPF